MRLIFAGTPEIAARVLARLLQSEHLMCAVLTQPDRPAGRGQKLLASPVKVLAEAQGVPVHQPTSLKNTEIQTLLAEYQADLMIVVAYGLMVPEVVLEIPRLGCWNIHVSLLPRWRGAAPIQRAIEAGDVKTGVTIMQMDGGLDTGPILLQESVAITETMTGGELHDVLAEMGANLLMQALKMQETGLLCKKIQPLEGITYAAKINKDEALINWHKTACELDCQIRAFNPWPIAYAQYKAQTVRVLKARVVKSHGKGVVGEIIAVQDNALWVQAGEGVLELQIIQLPGGRALDLKTFLNGRRDFFIIGSQFL